MRLTISSLLVVLFLVSLTSSDNSKDKEECVESLVGLATCLAYVGGDAKAPTADCCSGLKQVLKTNKKCLCVVIKDRNDPDLGINVNVTRAAGLPDTCNAPANISQCPALLNLPPNSPDAQIFYQFGPKPTNHGVAYGPVAGGPTASAGPTSGDPQQARGGGSGRGGSGSGRVFGGVGGSMTPTTRSSSNGSGKEKRLLGMEITCGLIMVLLWALNVY